MKTLIRCLGVLLLAVAACVIFSALLRYGLTRELSLGAALKLWALGLCAAIPGLIMITGEP